MHYDKYQNRGRCCAITGKCCLKVLCVYETEMPVCMSFSFIYPGNNESGKADNRGWGRECVGVRTLGSWFLSLINLSSCPLMPPT